MRIIKEGAIYFGATVLEKAVPFILLPFLTRVLTKEEYGMIYIFQILVMVYGLFVGIGLVGFIRVVYHKVDLSKFRGFVANTLMLALISSLFVLLASVLFENHIASAAAIDRQWIYLVLVAAVTQFLINLRLAIYQTMRMPLSYGKLQLVRPVVDIVLVIVLVFYLAQGGDGRIIALVLANVIAGIIAGVAMYNQGLFGLVFNGEYSKRALRFVMPLLPHSIALMSAFTLDKLILSSNLGLSIVGELAVAVAVASPTLIITESINRAFMPWSFERFKKGDLDNVVGASYLLLGLMFIVCVVYSSFLYFTIELIVGQTFSDVLLPAVILVWVGWLKLAYYLVIKGIVFREKTSSISWVSVISVMVYLSMILLSIDILDLHFIAWYMIGYHLMMFFGVLLYSQMIYPQPWMKIGTVHAATSEFYSGIVNMFVRKKRK